MIAFPSSFGGKDSDSQMVRSLEAQQHGGEVVARLNDGTNVYAQTYTALYQLLAEKGIDAGETSMEEIPVLGESQMY